MPHNVFSEVTDILHDWDGVYVHSKDFEAFWGTSAKIALESGIRNCFESAAVEIKEIWLQSQSTNKPYETAFDVLHYEFGLDFKMCFRRHHEILLSDYKHTFSVVPDVATYLKELGKWQHHVLTHANHSWVSTWIEENATGAFFESVYSCEEDAIGRKDSACLSVYRYVQRMHQPIPEKVLLLDDSLINLKHAKKAGMKTVWIKGQKESVQPDYVDKTYVCIRDFLKDLSQVGA